MRLLAGLLALCTVTVLAISSGNSSHCDALHASLGCSSWGTKVDPNDDRRLLVNRLNCTMAGTRLMAWTKVPARTNMYTVRSGREGPIASDVAYYHPNEFVTITVRATQYKKRYRGLLLYAVNAMNEVVGWFQFAPESEAVPFWTPSYWSSVCAPAAKGNGLLHKNADEKPYTINFRWKAPPAGTGAVTFRALFKSGPANDGEFFWPSNDGRNDLVLSERNPAVDGPVPAKTWFKATTHAQTCADVCTAAGRSGVDTTLMMQTNDGGDGMSTYHPSAGDAYGRTELCRAPFVSSCASDSPAIDTATSFCTYTPSTCETWRTTAQISTRLRLCACLSTTSQIQPCPLDQGWPVTAAGVTASLGCPVGQTGNRTRTCSGTGVWGTVVSTCVAVPTCTDGIQNQGEYATDCGGTSPCAPCLFCPTINCGSYGTCVEANPPTCTCNSSWTGNRCEVPPANPCSTWVCANSGTCQNNAGVATCLCTGVWIGPHCDQLPAPTCVDGIKNQAETGVDCGGTCPPCDSFFWEVGVWSECDRSCGGGIRTRGQTCKNSTGQVRPSTDCAGIHLPITSEACNVDPCPVYTWVAGAWAVCNTACGGGLQTRAVDCWSSIGPSIVTTPGLCLENLKPVSSQVCNTPACAAPRWVSDPWGLCSMECGGGIQTRANRCFNPSNVEVAASMCTTTPPATQQACNLFACVKYDWFLCPNWGPCTATCGGGDGMLGQQYRDLFCESSDGKQVDFSLCDPLLKPKNVLTVCNTFPCNDFNWMANGDWSACNGTYRERSFHCHAKDGAVALSSQCKHVPLPISAIPCTPGLTECYAVPPTPFYVSAAPKMQSTLPFVLAAVSSLVNSPRMGVLSVALLALSFVVPTEAHNWMHTPGRASFQASTVAPCQARKDSDLHAQVIRDQRFTLRFATGHERPSYFVTVMGDDAEWLGNDNFESMVDDYLAKATNEDHLSDYKRRYHGYNGDRYNQASYDNANDPIGAFFSAKIPPTDYRYPGHTRANATGMYVYKDSSLSSDRRASYYSALYPWIISAARLPHLYHLPDDFDAIHWTIPTQSNVRDGHVVVHWRWSGYYDCIDVDLRAGSTPVANPDGILNRTAHVWSQVDHCQYENPINILTQCMEVVDTVQPCINAIGQGDWNANFRYGVNVVPFRNPASVNPDFANEVYIPWRNGACSSSWNRLTGEVSETMLDWSGWLSTRTDVTTGQSCANVIEETWGDFDLKRAVAYCVGISDCGGIAWNVGSGGATVQSPGKKRFRFCGTTGGVAEAGWNLYRPKPGSLTQVTYQNNAVSIINFAPLSRVAVTGAQAGMVTDAGYMYGARNGQTYGWSCDSTVDCEWCCSTWDCTNGNALPGCCNGNIDFTYNYGANMRCPNQIDNWKYFNYALGNGVYEVQTRHQGPDLYLDVDIGGCNVEGVRMVKNRDDPTPPGVQLTTLVEVTDGKLTFNGDAGTDAGCWYTNWIKFSYKGPVGTWDRTWMPDPVANPVWEQNVGSPKPIGLVTVENFRFFRDSGGEAVPHCASWWLFKGSYCYPNKASGWFNDTLTQGAIVGVSNVSCLTGNCAGFIQCGLIQKAEGPWDTRYFVDCNGKVGQYVFVKLPGSNRYLTLDIEAYLFTPQVVPPDNPLVCYGVEARPATTTSPEYIISLDPEDPIFYSTCYVRNPNVIWLPIVGAPPSNPDRWRFNGRCIDCDSFERNKAVNKVNFAALPVPWKLADGHCVDCSAESQPLTPPATVWTQTYMSTCDDPFTPTPSTVARGLPPCAGAGFDSCQKRLFARGRTESEPTWGSAVLTATECQAVANNDAECTGTVNYFLGNGWSVCECQRAHPCCGRCTPNTWSGTDPRTPDPKVCYQIYERSLVVSAPDQFCSSGLKSADNALCCPSYCKNSAGVNVCGNSQTCKTVVGGGTCCKGDQTNLFVKMCTVAGPPCKLL